MRGRGGERVRYHLIIYFNRWEIILSQMKQSRDASRVSRRCKFIVCFCRDDWVITSRSTNDRWQQWAVFRCWWLVSSLTAELSRSIVEGPCCLGYESCIDGASRIAETPEHFSQLMWTPFELFAGRANTRAAECRCDDDALIILSAFSCLVVFDLNRNDILQLHTYFYFCEFFANMTTFILVNAVSEWRHQFLLTSYNSTDVRFDECTVCIGCD